jgi:biopolymer transport protein ExbB
MLDMKRTSLIALLGAAAMAVSAPAFAQDAGAAAGAGPAAEGTAGAAAGASGATGVGDAAAAGPATAPATAPADMDGDGETAETEAGAHGGGGITPISMFMDAGWVVKIVMLGLILASVFTWTLLIIKLFEFSGLNKSTDRFIEAFRGARSIEDMGKIATSEEFEGNPLADMAAAASQEVQLSRQAGLQVSGEHRASTINRALTAVGAVQAGLAKRLSGGQQFLASVGSSGPFIGLFGTVWGIMTSFIGIAESNTTNLAVVAPGIAEALLATGIGLFAAIPAVIFYNIFQSSIASYGTRSEGFVAELTNAISRQLDKGV